MPNEPLTVPNQLPAEPEDASAEVETYRFTADEFTRLGEAGMFDGERVELLNGQVIVMSPIGKHHGGIVLRLHTILHQRLGQRVLLPIQSPAVVDEFSEPLPDIMLVKPKLDYYVSGHPKPDEIFLLIEVSDTTLRYDRGSKLRKYAETGITEVWIVNLQNMTIEQYREPAGNSFASQKISKRGETITIAAFPDCSFAVEELIG